MFLKKIANIALAAGAIAAAAALPASADGYGRPTVRDFGPPPFSWTGLYAGVHLGSAWSQTDGSFAYPGPLGVAAAGGRAFDDSSFTGGVQIGLNWQTANFVWGLEADYSFMNMSTGGTMFRYPLVPGDHFDGRVAIDGAGSLRARLGLAVASRTLLYVTGGLAFADVEVGHSFVRDGVLGASGSNSAFRTGWTLGAGLEHALTNNWTIRGEYRYSDYGSINVLQPGFPAVVSPSSANFDITAHDLRLGLNYKF